MKGLAVIVPVKSKGAKSRLSSVVSPEGLRELNGALLANVLAAVEGAGLIASCFVVSSDPGALGVASAAGATPVPEEEDVGVNGAVARGAEAARGADACLVLPSDLPLLSPEGVGHLVSLWKDGFGVVVSPSLAFDGTNALVFPTAGGFRLSYDRDSFWNHLLSAARQRLSVAVSARPDVTLDLDTPDDLAILSGSPSEATPAQVARRLIR